MPPIASPNTRHDTHHAHFDGPLISGCMVCKTSHNLKNCARCKLVFYCGTEHQTQDWTAHKAFCTRVRKAKRRCNEGEENLRADTYRNYFGECPGRFWDIVETRDYMCFLMELADAQFTMKTTKAVQAGLESCMELHRLCRSDDLSVRQITPIQMIRLGMDQEAYDFLKWWCKIYADPHYDSGDLSLPYLDLKDEDMFEPIDESINMEYLSLSDVACKALLKLRLFIDYQALDGFNIIMEKKHNPLPREIMDEVRGYLMGSAVLKETDPLKSADEVFAMTEKLESELEIYFSSVHEANRHFWPALLNPNQKLEEYPSHSSTGGESEMQVTLRYIYPAFVETPGAMRLVRAWWTRCGLQDLDEPTKRNPGMGNWGTVIICDG